MKKDKHLSETGTFPETGVKFDQLRQALPSEKLEKRKWWHPNYLNQNLVLIIATLLMALLSISYLLSYRVGVFPDELAHLGYVVDSAHHGMPNYHDGKIFQTETLNYLEHPSLYYAIAGLFAQGLSSIDGDSAKYIRLLNVLFSGLTLFFVYRAMRYVGLRSVDIGFGLSVLLCVPMFTLLGGAINNDPLSVLGCALGTAGLIDCHRNKAAGPGVYLLVGGFLVAFLSKATGALALLCIIVAYAILNFKHLKNILTNCSRYQHLLIVTSIGLVCLYYALMLTFYGEFFPSPQGNPSDWFKIDHPDAKRWELTEHLVKFYESNLFSFSKPYGHAAIHDHELRELILKIIFAFYPLFIFFAIFGEARSKSGNAMLLVSFVLAQIVFLVIYFFKIRSMHISTGYPGAMQARYFFGLLPALVILYAVGFKHLSLLLLRLPMLLLVFAGLGLTVYPHFERAVYPVIENTRTTLVFGELTSGRVFSQKFVSPYGMVYKIELFLATFARSNSGPVKLEVLDSEGVVVSTSSLLAEKLVDNAFVSFPIEGFAVNIGEEYTLKLTAMNSNPGNAITWWAYRHDIPYSPVKPSKSRGERYGESNVNLDFLASNYTNRSGSVDGQSVDADFSYRVYFSR